MTNPMASHMKDPTTEISGPLKCFNSNIAGASTEKDRILPPTMNWMSDANATDTIFPIALGSVFILDSCAEWNIANFEIANEWWAEENWKFEHTKFESVRKEKNMLFFGTHVIHLARHAL